MEPKKGLDRKDEPEEPLDNQRREWQDEDLVIEDGSLIWARSRKTLRSFEIRPREWI